MADTTNWMQETFTDQEKRDCAERELKMRQRVYARRVSEGQMSQKQADKEIGLMKAIRDDYDFRVRQQELPLG